MKNLIAGLAVCLMVWACNDRTESASSEERTTDTGSAMAVGEDTAMNRNSSAQLKESIDKMMSQMKSMTPTGDPDNDFAMMMMVHHQGAVDMAQVQINNGTDTSLVAIARHIDSTSKKQIAELDSFLVKNKPDSNAAKKKSGFATQAMQMMDTSGSRSITPSGNVDNDFAAMMISHHKEGIQMAKLYLTSAKANQTKIIANEIIRQQPKEIKRLETL